MAGAFLKYFSFVLLTLLLVFGGCTPKRKQAELAIRAQIARMEELASLPEPLPLLQAAVRAKQFEKLFTRELHLEVRDPNSGKELKQSGSQELGQLALAVWQRYPGISVKSEGLILMIAKDLDSATASLRLHAQSSGAASLGTYALTLDFISRDKTWLVNRIVESR